MPNDTTHTGIDWDKVPSIETMFENRINTNISQQHALFTWVEFEFVLNEAVRHALSRPPAEPKAGDWDAVLLDTLLYSQGHGINTPPHEDPSDILDEYEKSIPDGAYRESIRSIRRALSSAAPRIVGDWEGFVGTMRAERDSHLAKSDKHVHDRNMGLAMKESDAAKQYEWVINVAEKFRGETPPLAPAPLSGVAKREWVSVDECDWPDGGWVEVAYWEKDRWIIHGLSCVLSSWKDRPDSKRFICRKTRDDNFPPPPFTPTQTEE